jgi:hypothetical protein
LELFTFVASKTWVADAVRQSAITPIDTLASASAIKFARAVKLLAEYTFSAWTAVAHHIRR